MDTDLTAGVLSRRGLSAAATTEPRWRPLPRAARRLALPLVRAAGGRAGALLAATVLPLTLLALWHVAAEREWVSPLILPPPAAVGQVLHDLWSDGTIASSLAVSTARVARGFGIAAVVGLGLGISLGLSPRFRGWVQPTVFAVYQVNVMAWIPLMILIFGIDEPLKTAAIAYASVLPITINTAKGIAGIPAGWLELARVHQLKRHEVVWRIAVPAALPSLFAGARSGLGAAWMSLVAVEMVASSEGIGYLVVWGRQLFQLDVVIAAVALIGLVGLALDLLLAAAERRLRRWNHGALRG